ncbi:MAG: ECF transporter S component [Microbacteriaceae bacterium]|jgi:energy-coupling factor transport system substrate-specific component|nr:ECF transporter S component [Microbacteriaceae bacterium]MCI1207126.1 ECF transporter S component [Microbacteriaceae bacterium]
MSTSVHSRRLPWRVVDIVVASVLGVALGVLFWIWAFVYKAPSAGLEALLPGFQGLVNGIWLMGGVVGGLVIRKPGAAIYTELLAAVVEALLGSQWGVLTLVSGIVQGLGAEVIFAIFLYRRWNLGVAILAGAVSGLFGAVNDLIFWYPGSKPAFMIIYPASTVISAAIGAGLLGWLLVSGLAKTGALAKFPVGRTRV